VDELGARTGLTPAELLGRLAELELSGQARRLPGSLFLRG
jgi:predicted Rossmann fold nucleotide-binding protein DprA/Smf involved in DNA uptake